MLGVEGVHFPTPLRFGHNLATHGKDSIASAPFGGKMTLAESIAEDSALPRFFVPRDARDWGRRNAISERDPRRAALMLVETAVWYAASILFAEVVGTWWAWAITWISVVACMMRIDAIQHEGVHRSLFRSKFGNDLVACIAGTLEGLHSSTYRCYHLAHHALTRQTGDPSDPEDFYDELMTRPKKLGPITVPARLMYLVGNASGALLPIQLLIDALATLSGRPPAYIRVAALERHVRRWGLVPIALWVVAVGAAMATNHGTELLTWWIVPMVMFISGPYVFFALSEHYGAPADGQMVYSTGSVESNGLYRWITLDGNYHLAHHVFPNASWWWLRAADNELQDDRTIRHSGYLRFHRQVWADTGQRRSVPND
jgi:fatty acid desaturase